MSEHSIKTLTKLFIGALLAGLVLFALLRLADRPSALSAEAMPANCALLDEATIAASFEPPSTKADYDRTLAVLERKIDAGGAGAMFLTEAANRRFQRFQNLRDVADLTRAEELTERQLASDPEMPSALSRRAALRGARHDFAGALADAEQAGTILQQIDALDELGMFDKALALLESVPPKGLGALLRHARAADNSGDADRAAELLEAGIQDARYGSLSFMSLAGLLAQRATLALHNGDYESACGAYTEALSLHPGQVSTLEWLGRWAWFAQKQELAYRFINRAAELDPQNATLRSVAAEMAAVLHHSKPSAPGTWAAAHDAHREEAKRLEAQWPDWYRLNTAERMAQAGEQEAALALLEQERDRRQGREWLASALAIYTEIGDFSSAAEMLNRLQSAGVLHPPVLYRAWEYYRASGEKAAARKAAEELIGGRVELDPAQWSRLTDLEAIVVR